MMSQAPFSVVAKFLKRLFFISPLLPPPPTFNKKPWIIFFKWEAYTSFLACRYWMSRFLVFITNWTPVMWLITESVSSFYFTWLNHNINSLSPLSFAKNFFMMHIQMTKISIFQGREEQDLRTMSHLSGASGTWNIQRTVQYYRTFRLVWGRGWHLAVWTGAKVTVTGAKTMAAVSTCTRTFIVTVSGRITKDVPARKQVRRDNVIIVRLYSWWI